MQSNVLRVCLLFALAVSFTASSQTTSQNIQTKELASKVFNNTRTIRILIPPDYQDPAKSTEKYPVLYLNDGWMVFDNNENGIRIEEILRDLYAQKKIPPYLVIGIDNGASTDKTQDEIRDRANEFLPYADAGFSPGHTYEPVPPSPQGKLYPKFLIEEVMPFINRSYRTKTGPKNTAIGGFSYGGVSALYTVIAHPNVFGKLLVESTPLYIGHREELMQDAEKATVWPRAVYVGSGTKESDEEAFNEKGRTNQIRLIEIIKSHSPQSRLKLYREEGATHDTTAWRNRLPGALTFLLSE